MALSEEDEVRLNDLTGKLVLNVAGEVNATFPKDWEEAMGHVLGAMCEHVMNSTQRGIRAERIRFVEAFNKRGDVLWVLHYMDAERLDDEA
jgi:hypothetical protein